MPKIKILGFILFIVVMIVGCTNQKKYYEGIEELTEATTSGKTYDVVIDTDNDVYHVGNVGEYNGYNTTVNNKGFYFCEGYSIEARNSLAPWYFCDLNTSKKIILCSRVGCEHKTTDCEAYFLTENYKDIKTNSKLNFYQNRLYCVTRDSKNGTQLVSYDETGNDMVIERVICEDSTYNNVKNVFCEGRIYTLLTKYHAEKMVTEYELWEIDIKSSQNDRLIMEGEEEKFNFSFEIVVSDVHKVYFHIEDVLYEYNKEQGNVDKVFEFPNINTNESGMKTNGYTNLEILDEKIYCVAWNESDEKILCFGLKSGNAQEIYGVEKYQDVILEDITEFHVDNKYIYINIRSLIDSDYKKWEEFFGSLDNVDDLNKCELIIIDRESSEIVYQYGINVPYEAMDESVLNNLHRRYEAGEITKAEYLHGLFNCKLISVGIANIDERGICLFVGYRNWEYITEEGKKDEGGTHLLTLDKDLIGTGKEVWEWIE